MNDKDIKMLYVTYRNKRTKVGSAKRPDWWYFGANKINKNIKRGVISVLAEAIYEVKQRRYAKKKKR
jgi:hypothetical protein